MTDPRQQWRDFYARKVAALREKVAFLPTGPVRAFWERELRRAEKMLHQGVTSTSGDRS